MRYQISGKQIDIGEALQIHVKAELGEVVEKYAQRPTEAVVVFSRVAHEYVCEAVIHLSTGLTAQAAFDCIRDQGAVAVAGDPDHRTRASRHAPAFVFKSFLAQGRGREF